MPVTIRDVAKRLNLSITTVSRAMDGYYDVAEETQRLVNQTAQEMGYVPNQAARQLRRQRSDTIGYLLPSDTPHFSDPYVAELVAGLGDQASEHGYDLLVATAQPGSTAEQRAYERWTHGRKVDGLIITRLRLQDWRVQYLLQMGFPFVTKERSDDPGDYPSVEVDGKRWFRLLMEHLIALGHRRIAYIGASAELKIQSDRSTGYRQALEAEGLPLIPELIQTGNLSAESGYQAAQRLLTLPNPPTAIACVDDMTATGVLHAAHDHGIEVGSDLAVAGFDGILGSEYTQPPLTTVNQPVYQIARRMVELLIHRIHGESPGQQQIFIEPELVIRQSTQGRNKN
jgi:DNA-binding LacI/PurR family transcriptional regulator